MALFFLVQGNVEYKIVQFNLEWIKIISFGQFPLVLAEAFPPAFFCWRI